MAIAITQTANPAGVNGSGNTVTYTGAATGTAAADRITVVTVTNEDATAGAPTKVTVGGIDCSKAAAAQFTAQNAAIFHVLNPTGTTADIVVTYTGTAPVAAANHIAVYSVTGADSGINSAGTHTSTDMDATAPLTLAIVIPTGGGAIAVASGAVSSSAAKTWANITEDLEVATGNYCHTTATRTTSGSVTITCTGGTNQEDGALACVVFNPPSERQTNRLLAASVAVAAGVWGIVQPQPLQAVEFNPSIFAAAVTTDNPPGFNSRRIVEVPDDPLPQVNRKLPQTYVYNPAFTLVEQAHTAWRVEFTLPQVGSKIAPLIQAVAAVDNPPRKQGLTYAPPPALDPSYQLQRRILNPQLTAVQVDAPPGFSSRRIVTIEDEPLPQVNRKLAQPLVVVSADNPPPLSNAQKNIVASWDVTIPVRNVAPVVTPSGQAVAQVDTPPFRYRQFSWGPGADIVTAISSGALVQSVDNPPFGAFYTSSNIVPLAWRPADPLPTLNRKLPPTALAVAVDTVLSRREPWSIQAWWRLPPPMPVLAENLSAGIPGQSVDNPPKRSTRNAPDWTPPVQPPQLPKQLSPAIPGQSVDNPPKRRTQNDPDWTTRYEPQKAKQLSPGIPGQSVDQPPRLRAQQPVWQQPDALPQLPPKLVPIAAAVTTDTVLSVPQPWSIQTAWRGPDPLPTVGSKLPPSLLAVAVDSVPGVREPWAVQAAWRLPPPLPILTGELSPSITAVAVNDPPFSSRRLVTTWPQAEPLPTLSVKLVPIAAAVVADTVLASTQPWSIQVAWRLSDPLPTLARKLPPSIAAVPADTVLSVREPWAVQSWWRVPPPLPTLAGKLSPSALAVPVNNPPFGSRSSTVAINSWAIVYRPQDQAQLPPVLLDNPTVEPVVTVTPSHGRARDLHRTKLGVRYGSGDIKRWREYQLRNVSTVIDKLEKAKDEVRGDSALDAAADIAEDIFRSAALQAAIDAVDQANNRRAQIVLAIAEAKRLRAKIQQEAQAKKDAEDEEDDDDAASLLL